jgi:hypothetical protein
MAPLLLDGAEFGEGVGRTICRHPTSVPVSP